MTEISRRTKVFREIVETEKVYVAQLDAIFELYIRAIDDDSGKNRLLSSSEADLLFRNVKQIRSLHMHFLRDLKNISETFSDSTEVSKLFLEFSPFFKSYTTYANRHDDAAAMFAEIMQSKALRYSRFQVVGLAYRSSTLFISRRDCSGQKFLVDITFLVAIGATQQTSSNDQRPWTGESFDHSDSKSTSL